MRDGFDLLVHDGGISIYARLKKHFGLEGVLMLAIFVAEFGLSYDRVADQDSRGTKILARYFSFGVKSLITDITLIAARRSTGAFLSAVATKTVDLLKSLECVDENFEGGLLARLVHPQTTFDDPKKTIACCAEVVYTLIVAGLIFDAAADYQLFDWNVTAVSACIFGVIVHLQVQIFKFVRIKENGEAFVNRLGNFVARHFALAELSRFTMQVSYNIIFMQCQYRAQHLGGALPIDKRTILAVCGGVADQAVPEQRTRMQPGLVPSEQPAEADPEDGIDESTPPLDLKDASLVGGRVGFFCTAPLGSYSSYLKGFANLGAVLLKKIRGHARYWTEPRGLAEKADIGTLGVAWYFAESCWKDAEACAALVKSKFVDGCHATYGKIEALRRGDVPEDSPECVLAITFILPSFLPTIMLPWMFVATIEPPFYVIARYSLAATLAAYFYVRDHCDVYMIMLLAENLRRRRSSQLPRSFVTDDGLRWDLGALVLYEPTSAVLLNFLWAFWHVLRVFWLSLFMGYAFTCVLVNKETGAPLSETEAKRRGATAVALPGLPERFELHWDKESYESAGPAPDGTVHAIHVACLRDCLVKVSPQTRWRELAK